MWRRLQECCEQLAGECDEQRRAAWELLRTEEFVGGACREAVVAGAPAQASLERSHELLSAKGVATRIDELTEDAGSEAGLRVVRHHIAAAQVAIFARQCAAGEAAWESLLQWIDRRVPSRFVEGTRAPPAERAPASRWVRCAIGVHPFHHPSTVQADLQVQNLLLDACPSPPSPSSEAESRLRQVLRRVRLEPPLCLEDLPKTPPEKASLPTAYALAYPSHALSFVTDEHLAVLPPLLTCEHPRLRTAAAILLGCLVPQLTATNPFPPHLPSHAATADRPEPEGLADAVMACMNDPSPYYRRVAAELIGHVAGAAGLPGALTALARRLRDPWREVRMGAAESVARIGAPANTRGIRSGLRRLLDEEEDEGILAAGLRAVARLCGLASRVLIDRLPRLLDHPSAVVRIDATRVVLAIGPRAARPAVVATLLRRLRDQEVAADAVLAYGALRIPPTDVFLGELARLLQLEDSRVVAAALQVVTMTGPPAGTGAILDGVVSILVARKSDLIRGGVDALGAIGPHAAREDVLLAVDELLLRGPRDHAQAAFDTLARLGKGTVRRLLAKAVALLADPRRHQAVNLLRWLGDRAATPDVLDQLVRLLRHEDPPVRAAAVAAVEAIGPAAATPVTMELLAEMRGDADADVRYHVGEALFALT